MAAAARGPGPVGCKARLAPFLPTPVVVKTETGYALDSDRPLSIGKVKAFYGNFGVCVKAYAYILSLGGKGLREASEAAVLNANYIMHRLRDTYEIRFHRPCMHEFVLSTENIPGLTATDVAKGLIDRGIHPPTIYFPLIVHEAMMVEPTESEAPETLDAFCEGPCWSWRASRRRSWPLTRADHAGRQARPDAGCPQTQGCRLKPAKTRNEQDRRRDLSPAKDR